MAIRSIEDIPKEYEFGRRLFRLGENHGMIGPAQISSALYENRECFRTIHPGGHKYINKDYRTKDIQTISKAVQRSFKSESACDVPGECFVTKNHYQEMIDMKMAVASSVLYGRLSSR